MMVFDWVKAAKVIRDACPKEAIAGLHGYMTLTAVMIWRDGSIHKNGWGIAMGITNRPILRVITENGKAVNYECWRSLADTPQEWIDKGMALRTVNWPEDAEAILGES